MAKLTDVLISGGLTGRIEWVWGIQYFIDGIEVDMDTYISYFNDTDDPGRDN